jgi:hypothetical protein
LGFECNMPTSSGGSGRWGLGYSLNGPDEAPGLEFGHGGYGGATGFANVPHGLAIGIVKNRMGGSLPGELVETIKHCTLSFGT